jgi:release factor glutamine methyltransferase
VARENALRLGAYRVSFSRGDLYDGLRAPFGAFDLIVANPPYVPTPDLPGLPADVRDFEPRCALDGGDDGVSLLRRVVEGARPFLSDGGILAVEVGAGEAERVAETFAANGFENVVKARDYGKIERVVHGAKRS